MEIMFEDVAQEVLLEEAVYELARAMEADYASWNQACADRKDGELSDWQKQQIADFKIEVQTGNKYYKLVGKGSVKGFVCKTDNDKKGFQVGDLLKAAGYNAPATNFARGTVFDANTWNSVRWTGIG